MQRISGPLEMDYCNAFLNLPYLLSKVRGSLVVTSAPFELS